MGIGVGIFLIAIGAILTFAVHWHIAGVDLQAVGWVLMLAGLAGVILFFAFWQRRGTGRVVSQRQTTYQDPVAPRPYEQTVSERRVFDDPPPPPGA
jgi:uncharacterized protein DUF6458